MSCKVTAYPLYIYDKSERESLTDGELVEILRRNGLG